MQKVLGVLLACVLVASCGGGGGGGSPPPAPATFTVGGTVAGLAGTGLTLLNNGAALAVNGNGAFTFSGTVASGSSYNVTVGTQPTMPTQLCQVGAGTGTATANVTSISVTCTTSTFSVGFTVSGLFGTGLVLENNAGNPITVTSNGAGTFSTAIASGAAYNVAVRTQPTATPPQTCTVASGAGTVGDGNVTGVAVRCSAQAGRFVYVATAAPAPGQPGNGVAAFTIDANTGALTPMAGSPFAATDRAPRVLLGRLGKFLYVYGDDNVSAPGSTTLIGFTVDAQTGALTPIAGLVVNLLAAAAPPAFHPNGNFLYVAVSDGALSTNNQLRGFAINPTTGMLTEVPGSPYGPIAANEVLNSVVLSPDGANLYLASSTPLIPGPPIVPPNGRITRFAVDLSTGALSAAMPSFTVANNSFQGLFMHPAGTHIYTRNSTSPSQPLLYASHLAIDPATGNIGTKTDIETAFGFGLVIAPAGRVYFPGFGGTFGAPQAGSVAGYIDAQNGAALPGSPYLTGGTNSLAQVLDPTGRFMAFTNGGSDNVTVMRINPADGSLAQVAGSPYAPAVGTEPGTVTFDPSARFAYLTDTSTSSISSYAIDVDTGIPTFVNSQLMLGSPSVAPLAVIGLQ